MESNNNARDLRAVSELLATLHVQSLEESFCEHCRQTKQARQWVAFTLESITPAHRALSDFIYSTAEVDEESAYQWTLDNLEWLQEQLQDNADATLDNMDESDAINEYIDGSVDIYNYALLQWLTKGNNHIYIEDALSEFGMPSKGNNMQLISMAQYKARADHFYALLRVAQKYAQDLVYCRHIMAYAVYKDKKLQGYQCQNKECYAMLEVSPRFSQGGNHSTK